MIPGDHIIKGQATITFQDGTTFSFGAVSLRMQPDIVLVRERMLEMARLGAKNSGLSGRAFEAAVFDYMTLQGYSLNLLSGEWTGPGNCA